MPTATSLINRLELTQELKFCSHKVVQFFQCLAGWLGRITCSTSDKIFFKVTLNHIKSKNKQSDTDYLKDSTLFKVWTQKLEPPSSRDRSLLGWRMWCDRSYMHLGTPHYYLGDSVNSKPNLPTIPFSIITILGSLHERSSTLDTPNWPGRCRTRRDSAPGFLMLKEVYS